VPVSRVGARLASQWRVSTTSLVSVLIAATA
jgi:hypothetical protein